MPLHVQTVHLIFKTHLDIGFTDFARNVIQQYFDTFIPQAIETARILRQEGADRFVWTTGSWLICDYLERADVHQRRRMETAIEGGDLVWHGLPFTTHTELMDVSLFRYGLSLSQQLDRRFGKKTIAAKMTDVPGHTRGIIPLLAEAGIQFLHLGVNPASTPPDVPPVFLWRDPPSNARILVMYQKGSYGDVTLVPGLPDALAFAHTNDNHGPQSPGEVRQAFEAMRRHFPDAVVKASTLDHFAQNFLTVEDSLPVITGEMGDTWIHGVGTDPTKVSRFRALSRLRRDWLVSGQGDINDPHFAAFSRTLMMIPEHTWGMDEKMYLKDYDHYSRESFETARQTPTFQIFAASWLEQRTYIDHAVDALGDGLLAQEARQHLEAIAPQIPDLTGFERFVDSSSVLDTTHFELGFDGVTGAINHLVDKRSGHSWADEEHLLGLFRYETFSKQDYDRFWKQYILNKRKTSVWSRDDFTKPGIEAVVDKHAFWQPHLNALYYRGGEQGSKFLVELNSPDVAVTRFGCPEKVFIEITLPIDDRTIHFNLQWFNKDASRLPEAIWFTFNPKTQRGGKWELDKLGECISPLDVIRNGNRKLHAVDKGVYYRDARSELCIETLDAPLVAPGEPSLLNFNNRQPKLRHGIHFNLYNNVWGTNFPMWFDDDARFRFIIRLNNMQEK